ncbi:MAG: ATP-dependent Clp protease proteolytic subunit [Chloroflexi bacterium]|nr:ATP-dependent Clp protease proteolytic subunit [Chloroflexota bacterium]
MIREYEERFNSNLIVFVGEITLESTTYFEELLHDVTPDQDLHLLIGSAGGDGETALRILRAAQSRSQEFVVIVPDWAKSAATLIALGAHKIAMGPMSDLGPIDPQFRVGDKLVAAKDIIAAVEQATEEVRASPETFPLHAALLGDVSAILVERARQGMGRTESQLREALHANPSRADEEVTELIGQLKEPLIEGAQSHAALFGQREAGRTKLPVDALDPKGQQWDSVWRLWTRYVAAGASAFGSPTVYEGRRVSHIVVKQS